MVLAKSLQFDWTVNCIVYIAISHVRVVFLFSELNSFMFYSHGVAHYEQYVKSITYITLPGIVASTVAIILVKSSLAPSLL